MINNEVNKMTVKNEKMVRKMFDRVFDIAYYGAYADDENSNMGTPYEFEAKGEISEINSKIYDLRCKIAKDFGGEQCAIDDYEKLCELVSNYDKLIEKFCYKMFLYGFTINPKNLEY